MRLFTICINYPFFFFKENGLNVQEQGVGQVEFGSFKLTGSYTATEKADKDMHRYRETISPRQSRMVGHPTASREKSK